jgi:hypothetical protein
LSLIATTQGDAAAGEDVASAPMLANAKQERKTTCDDRADEAESHVTGTLHETHRGALQRL